MFFSFNLRWLGLARRTKFCPDLKSISLTGYPGHKLILSNLTHSAILTSLKGDQRVDSKLAR